ncbi:MAG TPA: hypothetical protein VLI45_05045 [Acidobacteriaceae bacterium]|nr:hypothetical protein [Acidobacteriaceae bacterium]
MATHTVKPGLLPPANAQEESGVDLIAVSAALLSEWRLGLITFAVLLIASAAVILSLKPKFVATAVIMPQNTRIESSTLAALLTTRASGGMYVGLLESRSVQDEVVDRTHLMQLLHTTSRESARGVLAGMSTFAEGSDTLISIKVKNKNAETAAAIANAYVDALKALNTRMSLEQSTETGDFFKAQLQEERGELNQAETHLESTQRKTGVVQPEMQTSIGLNAIAQVRAQITQVQVQLAALLRGATEQNPQVQRLKSQLAQLQAEEHTLELGTGPSPAGAAPSAEQLPEQNLSVLRAQREVTYHNALVTSLANQFEAARLMEGSGPSQFQVVDRAVAPERKAWPPRLPFLIGAAIFSAVVALLLMVCRLVWRRIESDPDHQARMALLREATRLR